ncbi:ABC transporter ATP-binding protein [Fructilactobacillus florum 8D]|uniref:ABC transporter ATP-binding protein n=1 Tax=Fructilactobacillus florum 8D TaxID=1221538 RepID=W9EDD2_9LACO|nr:ABC transporter ATP-binding protein [Fructilactobacillus florum]EKK20078.1 ABC transporter ATP-binding protein [Fructilactobacillus florum 2F]ETO40082.1 ABC transporter ATP-binding protein [Fructilactobacillus florum 8D]
MLEVRNVQKSFNKKRILKGVSFNIKKNDNIALLGSNGAGKSTLIKLISGEITPDDGCIETNLDFNTQVGIMPQDDILIDDLTVKEIISLKLNMCGVKKGDTQQLLKEIGLEDVSKNFVDSLSGGQKRRLSLLLSILNNPEMVFLDEPTTGMDLNAVDNFWKLMKTSKFTAVVITHDFNQIDNFFDRVLILDKGVMTSDITVEEIHKAGIRVEEYYRQTVRGGK